MKRPASAAAAWSVKGKLHIVEAALDDAEAPEGLKAMLTQTISTSLGGMKDGRHPFSAKFIAEIAKTLGASEESFAKELADKQAALEALTPAKEERDAAVTTTEATHKTKEEELTAATVKLVEAKATSKAAAEKLKEAEKAQKEGDKEYAVLESKKAEIVAAKDTHYASLIEGNGEGDADSTLEDLKTVAAAYDFDSSLLTAVGQVLLKAKETRTGFDNTCLEQMDEAFAASIGGFDAKIAEATPAKEARAEAVSTATAEKEAAEAALEAAKAAQAAAKEAVGTAKEEFKAAKKAQADYNSDVKEATGDVEDAESALTCFKEGALAAFEALKERNEEWVPPPKKVKVAEEPEAAAEEPAAMEVEPAEPAIEVAA